MSGREMNKPRYIDLTSRSYRAKIYIGRRTISCKGRVSGEENIKPRYIHLLTVYIEHRKISGGELPRAEEEASDRMSIETSSTSLLTHPGQDAQTYVYHSVLHPSRSGTVPRADERASGRGNNEPSGRRESLGRRKEPAMVYPS